MEPGHVHQAEHDGLRDGLRVLLEAPVAYVDRIDERDIAGTLAETRNLRLDRLNLIEIRWVCALFKLLQPGFKVFEFLRLGPFQGDAAGKAVAHGARDRDHGRRPGGTVARAPRLGLFLAHHLPLCEIGKLQILQEQVDELLVGQGEAELVLAAAVCARASLPAPGRRTLDAVALDVVLIARKQIFADAALVTSPQGSAHARHPRGR